MEMVECGGVLHKNAVSGGISHASILFAGPKMQEGLKKHRRYCSVVWSISEWMWERYLYHWKRKSK